MQWQQKIKNLYRRRIFWGVKIWGEKRNWKYIFHFMIPHVYLTCVYVCFAINSTDQMTHRIKSLVVKSRFIWIFCFWARRWRRRGNQKLDTHHTRSIAFLAPSKKHYHTLSLLNRPLPSPATFIMQPDNQKENPAVDPIIIIQTTYLFFIKQFLSRSRFG